MSVLAAAIEAWKPSEIVREIAMNSELVNINLVECGGEVLAGVRAGDTIESINIELEAGRGAVMEENHFSLMVGVKVTLLPKGQPEKPAAVVRCRYAAQYRCKSKEFFEELTNDALGAFTASTGTLTLWPYIREFVQSTALRMLLPPVNLPPVMTVFVEPPRPKAAEKTDGK